MSVTEIASTESSVTALTSDGGRSEFFRKMYWNVGAKNRAGSVSKPYTTTGLPSVASRETTSARSRGLPSGSPRIIAYESLVNTTASCRAGPDDPSGDPNVSGVWAVILGSART